MSNSAARADDAGQISKFDAIMVRGGIQINGYDVIMVLPLREQGRITEYMIVANSDAQYTTVTAWVSSPNASSWFHGDYHHGRSAEARIERAIESAVMRYQDRPGAMF